MKTAIVYDYLPAIGGGAERALFELISHFQKDETDTVDIFIGFVVDSPYSRECIKILKKTYTPDKVHLGPVIRIFRSILFRIYNFLLPAILQSYNLSTFDRVISYTAFLSHSITPPVKGKHIVYYNTPARFLWNLTHAESLLKKITAPLFITDLMRFRSRLYDLSGLAHNPMIIAISTAVQQRITAFYNKDSALLFPPAIKDELLTENYINREVSKIFGKKYFAHVSRIESYKNIDLIIDLTVCHTIPENIVIMGTGPYLGTLKKKLKRNYGHPVITTILLCNERIKLEKYSNIYLTDAVSEQVKFTVLANANALLSLNDEDFGITKIEALAVGTPVIAYAAGGSLDIITHGANGVFFEEPTTDSLYAVLQLHRILSYDKKKIIESTEPFTVSAFHHKLESLTNA